jgi:hypothetical protein
MPDWAVDRAPNHKCLHGCRTLLELLRRSISSSDEPTSAACAARWWFSAGWPVPSCSPALLLELVLLTRAGGLAYSVGPLETRWNLILWNPWFALGGLALIIATHQFQRA